MILVTGGQGFVGRHVVARLVHGAHAVRVLTRSPGRAVIPQGLQEVEGDLLDPRSLARAVAGVDAVVHLAARLDAEDEGGLMDVNVEGSRRLAAAARDAGVGRFIHCSSAGVYGDGEERRPFREEDPPNPGTPYERSKLLGEEAVREELRSSGVCWTVLRPSGVYGPDRPATAALFRQVAGRRVWAHGPTTVVVHPTHADDVAQAVALVLDASGLCGETLNVAGERALSYRELLDEIGARVGRRPVHLALPAWTASVAATGSRVARATGLGDPALLGRLSRRLVNRSVDIGRITAALGYAPVPLAQGLDETARAVEDLPR